jgi:hypothetical protein
MAKSGRGQAFLFALASGSSRTWGSESPMGRELQDCTRNLAQPLAGLPGNVRSGEILSPFVTVTQAGPDARPARLRMQSIGALRSPG